MFRIYLRIAGLLAALPLAFGGSASAAVGKAGAMEAAWAEASQRNTLEAYAEFVIAHPESRHIQQAYARLSSVGTVNLTGPGIPPLEGSLDIAISKPEFVPNSIMVV